MGESRYPDDPTRRRLLAGLGAGAAIGVAGALPVGPAGAQEGPVAAGEGRASPIATTIASPRETGITYVFRSYFDFSAEKAGTPRTYGGEGAFAGGAGGFLWTSVDLPLGAQLRDIEWYCLNTAGTLKGLARLWDAGEGPLSAFVNDTTIPVKSTVSATRSVVGVNNNGPYPHGTRLMLAVETVGNDSQQVNGVRVGYTRGPTELVVLPTPVRVYDSRPAGMPNVGIKTPLTPGEEREIDLKANGSKVPAGATAALLTILLVNAENGDGNFTVWRNGLAKPAANTLVWGPTGGRHAITAVTALDGAARCRVSASLGTNLVIDVLGYYV
jgi:hypothetical protein